MKKIVFVVSIIAFGCGAVPRSQEFLVPYDAKDEIDSKAKRVSKAKLNDLKEEVAFTSINSLEAIFYHIDYLTAQSEDNRDTIASLNRISQEILSCCRQWIDQSKDCYMARATYQSLSSLLDALKRLRRSMGQQISHDWVVSVEKNIKKICTCDTIKSKNK